jgi:hypothetical protein
MDILLIIYCEKIAVGTRRTCTLWNVDSEEESLKWSLPPPQDKNTDYGGCVFVVWLLLQFHFFHIFCLFLFVSKTLFLFCFVLFQEIFKRRALCIHRRNKKTKRIHSHKVAMENKQNHKKNFFEFWYSSHSVQHQVKWILKVLDTWFQKESPIN